MKKILTLVLTTLLLLSLAAAASAATSTETGTGVVVIKADDWANTYADISASYQKNAENKDIIDHNHGSQLFEAQHTAVMRADRDDSRAGVRAVKADGVQRSFFILSE